MNPSTEHLVAYALFGGLAIGLLWAALMGELLIGSRSSFARAGMVVLGVIGLVHPVAAIATWDLVRLDRRDPDAPRSWAQPASWAVLASSTVVVALVAGDAAFG